MNLHLSVLPHCPIVVFLCFSWRYCGAFNHFHPHPRPRWAFACSGATGRPYANTNVAWPTPAPLCRLSKSVHSRHTRSPWRCSLHKQWAIGMEPCAGDRRTIGHSWGRLWAYDRRKAWWVHSTRPSQRLHFASSTRDPMKINRHYIRFTEHFHQVETLAARLLVKPITPNLDAL